MNTTILVVDDDKHTHVIIQNLLENEFQLLHADDAQEAIDILSERPVNLILSDIHMPGMSGLEFLDSIKRDANKKGTPVLLMTNLPSVEKEQKAFDLGAADFINKNQLLNDKELVKDRIRMKLVSNISNGSGTTALEDKKDRLTASVMEGAVSNNFNKAVSILCDELVEEFDIDHVSMWTCNGNGTELVNMAGPAVLEDAQTITLTTDQGFEAINTSRSPYLTNHIAGEEKGFMQQFAEAHELPAEIAIPMFETDERSLLLNDMTIPDDTDLFAILILKRNKLFSSDEYELLSQLMVRFGSIFWRIYSKERA